MPFEKRLALNDKLGRMKYLTTPMPSTIPPFELSIEEEAGDYGVKEASIKDTRLARDILFYTRHCTVDINMDRGDAYVNPVQSVTMHCSKKVWNVA